MIPEQIVKTLLMADADVVAIVGNRVKPIPLPEGMALPAVGFQVVSTEDLHRPLAVTPGASALCRSRVRVFAISTIDKYAPEKSLMAAIRKCIGNKIGRVAGFNDVHIGPPMQAAEMPDPIADIRTEGADFMVTFREPLAS